MDNETKKNSTGSELSAKEIAEQAANKEPDEIKREILRDGESGETADEKDVAGSPDKDDTMYGREQAKQQTTDKTITGK